jgi:hypothetical protein
MKFPRVCGLALPGIAALTMLLLSGCSSNSASGTEDAIVVTPSATGTVSVVNGGSKSVTLSFNSSDANAISKLSVTSGLSMLPDGWSGPSAFTCATVESGSGCVLTLTYAPVTEASGTLTVAYSYTNNDGTVQTGSTAILYASTAHNTVSATAAPTGQITAVAGASQTVALTFTTDDGNPATALTVTALTGLPSGWTSAVDTFTCATVSTGSGCLLPLTFAPTSAGGGTLTLSYTYTDNAGAAKTGTVNLTYTETAHDNIVGTAAPTGQINAVVGGASRPVVLTFTTDDHNLATALMLTSDLAALPSGWSATGSSFACASVSIGNACQLHLSYAPSAAATGTLTLNYSYRDFAGAPKTGSLNIAYAATSRHAYVSDINNGLYMCSVDATAGTLANCQTTGGGFTGAWSVAFFTGSNANYAYVVDGQRANIYLCTVNSDGTLSNSCTVQGSNYSYAEHVTVLGSTLYAADQGSPGGGEVTLCTINDTDGTLSGCIVTASASGLNYASGITLAGGFGYVETDNNGLFTCAFDSTTGLLTNCAVAGTSASVGSAWNIVISGGVAYVANSTSGLATCAVDSAGNLSSCSNTGLGGIAPEATGIDVNGAWAYVSDWDMLGQGDVYLCSISGLTVSTCNVAVSDGSDVGFTSLTDVIIH